MIQKNAPLQGKSFFVTSGGTAVEIKPGWFVLHRLIDGKSEYIVFMTRTDTEQVEVARVDRADGMMYSPVAHDKMVARALWTALINYENFTPL